MKKRFDFEKGKVVTEYEEGDVVNTNDIGESSLTISDEQNAKLNELVCGLYLVLLENEEPPVSLSSVSVLLEIIDYKIGQLREFGEISE